MRTEVPSCQQLHRLPSWASTAKSRHCAASGADSVPLVPLKYRCRHHVSELASVQSPPAFAPPTTSPLNPHFLHSAGTTSQPAILIFAEPRTIAITKSPPPLSACFFFFSRAETQSSNRRRQLVVMAISAR